MPAGQIRALAKKSGVSVSVVERMWDACKKGIGHPTGVKEPYALVYRCTRQKLAKLKRVKGRKYA